MASNTLIDPAIERRTMVDSQLRTVGVTDEAVLAAMNSVARENFVPPALAGLAYADAALEAGTDGAGVVVATCARQSR
jgi:protein-L-isoaspartate O-methyltransferase